MRFEDSVFQDEDLYEILLRVAISIMRKEEMI